MDSIISHFSSLFPVWYTTRAAGLTAYLLLFVSMLAGMVQSMKWFSPSTRSVVLVLHNTTGWFGLLFGMVHGLVLLFDQYVGFSLGDILIPFATHDKTFANGIGILAFYIMLLLVLSSDLMKHLGKKMWRSIHFLAFPGYILALVHGVLAGTDTQYIWTQWMYMGTGVMVMLLFILRILLFRSEKNTKVKKERIPAN